MYGLGFDLETTGLDVVNDRIIEVGAIVFQVRDGVWHEFLDYGALIWDEKTPTLTPEIEDITKIKNEDLLKFGKKFEDVIHHIATLAQNAEFIVAHNAPFDKAMFKRHVEEYRLLTDPLIARFLDIPWICSAKDLVSNQKFKSWKLAHLALDYMVPVDPRKLHRAVADVRLMGQMLTGAKADPRAMIDYMLIPDLVIQIVVPHPRQDNGRGKDFAKTIGYSWQKTKGHPEEFPQWWVKKIKEDLLPKEKLDALQYPVNIIRRIESK